MMTITDDLDESDVLCQKHKSKFNLGFRVQTANLTKKELENLYYTMLDANIDLKKTVNAQNEQIKILNTKLYRITTLQKNMVSKEMSNSNFCCKSTKSLLEENKLSIVSLKKENQRLTERIRVLNMRLCSNKQFMVRQSPMQSLQTVRSTKIVSSTPNEKKLSFLNVPMQSFIVQYAQTGTNTSNDDDLKGSEEPKVECSSHKCCTEMQVFKEDLENLQQELSKTQQEYVERIAKLEVEMIKLHGDYIKEKNEKKMTDLNLVNQMKDNEDLAKRLKTAQLKCDELSMQLNLEKRRITELSTQIKAAQISDDVSKAIENHYAEKNMACNLQSEKIEPVIETLDENKYDDRNNDAAPEPTVDLNDTQREIATQWENGKQRRKSINSSKNIKSKTSSRPSSGSKKSSNSKVPSAIKSTTKHNSNEKPSSPKIRKKIQADIPTVLETTNIPEIVTSKNQDTQSIIPQIDIASGDDKKIIPYQNSEIPDEIEIIKDDFRLSNASNKPNASLQYPVVQYDPDLNKISSNTTNINKKSYETDFSFNGDILVNEPASENLIKIKKEISLYKNPENNSNILKLDKGENEELPNNQDYLLKEEKITDEPVSQYFSDKDIASEINKVDQNLKCENISQELNAETNTNNPTKISSINTNMNSISNIFNNISKMLNGEKPENDNNINKPVQVNDSEPNIKSNLSNSPYSQRTQQKSDELLVIESSKSINDKDKSLTSLTSKRIFPSKSKNHSIRINAKEITSESDNELAKGNLITENNRKISTGSKSSKRSVKINPHASSRTRSSSHISLTSKLSDKVSNGKIEKFSGVTNVSIKSKSSLQENKSDNTHDESKGLIIGKPAYSEIKKVKNTNFSNEKVDNIEIVDASQRSSPVLQTKTNSTNTPHRILKKDYVQLTKNPFNASDSSDTKSRLISKRPLNTTIIQRQARSVENFPRNNNDVKRNISPQSEKPIDKNNSLAKSQLSSRTDQESRSIMGPKIAFNSRVPPRVNQENQSLAKPISSHNRNVSPRREQVSESFTRPNTPPNRSVSPRMDQENQSLSRPKTPPNRTFSPRANQDNQSLVKPTTSPNRKPPGREQESESSTRPKTPPYKSVSSRTDQDESLIQPKMSPNRNISPRSDQESKPFIMSKTPFNRIVSSRANQDNQSLEKPKISLNSNASPRRKQESESFTRPKTPPSRSVSSRTEQENQSLIIPKTPPNKSVSSRTDQDIPSLIQPKLSLNQKRDRENESFTGSKTPPKRSVSPRANQENQFVVKPKTSNNNRNVSPRREQESESFKRSRTPPNRSVSPRAYRENQSSIEPKVSPNRNISPRREQETEPFTRSKTPSNRSIPSRMDLETPALTRSKTPPSRSDISRSEQESQPSVKPKMSPNRNALSRTNQENQSLTRSKTPPNRSVTSHTDQDSKFLTRPKTPSAKNNSSRTNQDIPNKNTSLRKDQKSESLTKNKTPPNRSGSPRMNQESQSLKRTKTPNSSNSSYTDQKSKPMTRPEVSTNKISISRTNQESEFVMKPPNRNVSSSTDQGNQSKKRPNTPLNKNVIVSNNRRPLTQSTPQKFNLLTDNNSSKNVLRKTKPLNERSMIKKVVMKPQLIPKPVANASSKTSPVNENIAMSSEFRNNDSGFGDDRNQDVEKLNNEDLLNMIFSLQKQLDELKSITTSKTRDSVTPEPQITLVSQAPPKRNEITVPVLKNVKDYDCVVVDPKENVILDIKHVNQYDLHDNLQQTLPPVPLSYNELNPQPTTESFYNPTEQYNAASSSNEPPYNKKHFEFNDDLITQEVLKNTAPQIKATRKSITLSERFPEYSRTATGQGPSKKEHENIPKYQSVIKSKHHGNVEKTVRENMSTDEFEKADQKITAAEKEHQIMGKLPRYFSGTSLWDQKRPKKFLSPPTKNDKSNNTKVNEDDDKPEPKPPPPPVDGNTIPFPVNQEKYLKNAANWMQDKKEQKKGEGGAGGGAGQRTGQSSRNGETSKIHHEEQQEPDLCAHFIKICRCPKTPRKDVELFRTCSGTLRFKAYDPASGGFRRCECSKNDREGGGSKGGPDDNTHAINISSNRFAMHPSPVSGSTGNDVSSTAMNSRNTRSNLGTNKSSSSGEEYDSTYVRSYTPPSSPYDQISEGEIKNSGERGVIVQPLIASASQLGNEKTSQNMEMTLKKISEELAKCNRMLMYQKNNAEHPTSLTRNASVQARGVSLIPEETRRTESVVTFVPKCVFTLYIASMVLSDEAVLQASAMDLVLMWKYYDQGIAMTEITPGRKIPLHSSSTYDIKLTDTFFDYMKKKEMKIVLCELNDQERIFGYCYLPLRDALINTNRRVDMSLALIAGPRALVNSTNPEFEIGVIDLWCHLQVQQKFMPYFNEAISKKSSLAQGVGRTMIDDNLNNTILPQFKNNNNENDGDVVCSEDLEILSESKRKRWIQQNDMKKYERRPSDSSSENRDRVGFGLKPNNKAMLQQSIREPVVKETFDREAGSTYKNETTSTRDTGKSLYHRKMDHNFNEMMGSCKSDLSSTLGFEIDEREENNHMLPREVPTKVKRLNEIEAAVEQRDRINSSTMSLKKDEYPLQSLNEQWKYYDQLPERDTVDFGKAPKDKKNVTIDEAKQKGEGSPESVDITILWLALNEESTAMNDNTIHRLFIAYSFLGNKGAELETPVSLPKPKHQLDKCHFNFKKSFVVITPMDFRQLGHLGKCFQRNQYEHNPKDCITFSVVSEPTEDPLGLADCEEIGYAYLYLGDLLQFSAGGDTYTEVVPIMCAKNPDTVMGVLSIKVDGLNLIRRCTRMMSSNRDRVYSNGQDADD